MTGSFPIEGLFVRVFRFHSYLNRIFCAYVGLLRLFTSHKGTTLTVHRYIVIFVLLDSLRPSQQFFSYVGTGLPGLNQY